MSFSIIAAIGKNRELGKNNQLIWHLPGDLKFFKKTTMGHPILMGRKTFESLPGLLPGRKHYVVSRREESVERRGGVKDLVRVEDLHDFVTQYQKYPEEIFVIGGAKIYEQLLPYADKLYLTEIEANDTEADAYFPDFDKEKYDKEILGQGEENGLKYTIVCYKLKK